MAATHSVSKRKLVGRTILFGALTAILYGVMFANPDYVVHLFARGGAYAALPIATVFVFSFAHGTFSGSLWSILGIEAVNKQTAKRPEARPTRPAQRPRPRLRMSV